MQSVMLHDHSRPRPGQNILPEPGRDVAVVTLDHGNRGAAARARYP